MARLKETGGDRVGGGVGRLGGGTEASDAAPDASVTILDALGFKSDTDAAAASWTTDSWFSAGGAVPPPK